MYTLLAQVAAPAITLLVIPALFGSAAQAGPVPQPADIAIKNRYRVPGAALPPLVNRKREAEADAAPILPRTAEAEPVVAFNVKRDASVLVTLPKREPLPNAAGSNVSLQPQKRGYGRGGCCGGGGWGW